MIVLDTHVWIWWVDDHPRFNRAVRHRIDAETDIRVSAISMLEVATAVARNRLILQPSAQEWLTVAQSLAQLRVEPLSAEVCLDSTTLPGDFHRDPGDRLIVALTRSLGCELITADSKILRYAGVRSLAAE